MIKIKTEPEIKKMKVKMDDVKVSISTATEEMRESLTCIKTLPLYQNFTHFCHCIGGKKVSRNWEAQDAMWGCVVGRTIWSTSHSVSDTLPL